MIKSKKRIYQKNWILIFVAIVAAIIILITYDADNQVSELDAIVTVNGEEITTKEYMIQVNNRRAETFDYFKQLYNVELDENFWTTSFNGEIPGEIIKKNALEECVRIKLQQILAKEKGLTKDISYKEYLSYLEGENKRRKEAVLKGQVIYGPQQYEEEIHFITVVSDLIFELKTALESELKITEEEMLEYYNNQILGSSYKKNDRIVLNKVSAIYQPEDKNGKAEVEEIMKEIKIKLDSGKEFDTLSQSYQKKQVGIEFGKQIMDASTGKTDSSRYNYGFTNKVRTLSVGEISDVFESNNTYYVVQCSEKTDGGYFSFDETRSVIEKILYEQKYEEFVDDLVIKAEIVIDQSIYDKINIQ